MEIQGIIKTADTFAEKIPISNELHKTDAPLLSSDHIVRPLPEVFSKMSFGNIVTANVKTALVIQKS